MYIFVFVCTDVHMYLCIFKQRWLHVLMSQNEIKKREGVCVCVYVCVCVQERASERGSE